MKIFNNDKSSSNQRSENSYDIYNSAFVLDLLQILVETLLAALINV